LAVGKIFKLVQFIFKHLSDFFANAQKDRPALPIKILSRLNKYPFNILIARVHNSCLPIRAAMTSPVFTDLQAGIGGNRAPQPGHT